MIRFILNDEIVDCSLPEGMVLLDFIRYHKNLKGTKIGCREGDCGACTVLTGEIIEGDLRYRSVTSCLMPLGNAHGKHIVTIEGINMAELTPVQQAMHDEGATQCGFCTPGFVMSLAGFCLSDKEPHNAGALAAIDGNICRCTGYKSIERAAQRITQLLSGKNLKNPAEYAVQNNLLPAYFGNIRQRMMSLITNPNGQTFYNSKNISVGGGTDLYVQQHESMLHSSVNFLSAQQQMKGIIMEEDKCIIGASVTVSDLCESPAFNKLFPRFNEFSKLVSSTPIRNMATMAGNFVNASPIGDFTIYFLALDSALVLNDGSKSRELPLRDFYKGYKQLAKSKEEFIERFYFKIPDNNTRFSFEKVSKRTHLDIASVNTAIMLKMKGDLIESAGISAGGVGPIPMYLSKSSSFLKNKSISENVIDELIATAQQEISPISDARGSEGYKRLLLGQLIRAHFKSFEQS